MNKPDDCLDSSGTPVKWEDILIVNGCDFVRYSDEYSDGIMMFRIGL
ncbi:hypothetical protein [Shewanella inventionis]|nr:hypothetical protein [Shewanella inventionis]